MNEFKGTKGRWEHETHNGCKDIFAKIGKRSRDLIGFTSGRHEEQEDVANVQLIVDAGNVRQQINCDLPELLNQRNKMLDFINRISGEMLRNDFVLGEEWYVQSRRLITTANLESHDSQNHKR